VEVIGTTGGRADPGELGLSPLPANAHITRWVRHADILPRCAALVTTGGPATIMAGLTAGVPLVVVPTTWDKPDNAQRVVESGVGVRLRPRRCNPDRLREAVERVLGDPSYLAEARRAQARLAAAPGPAGAAELLGRLASGRRREPAADIVHGGVT
jgi:UDP:flavonoid glycosyltransferase YjiC (YdhE family)